MTFVNVPDLADVHTMLKLLEELGCKVTQEGHKVTIDASHITSTEAPYDLVKTMRASILVLGPLLARFGKAQVSLPGGCSIGARPVDQHIKGLKALGADISIEHGYVTAHADKLIGTNIVTDMVTVTGTENGWTKVTIGGVSGYIRSDYVSGGGADSKAGYIKGTGVRMRSGASTTSSILGVYNTGTKMTITGESGNWYKVSYSGRDGYVSKDYMTTTKPDNGGGSTSQTGYIKGNDVRLRSGAGTNYSILGTYNNGTPLTITGTSGNWTAVTINGVKGYVNSTYVTTTKSDGGSKPSGSIGETIVATAKQYMGAPYVYGGMSPSGFDCSGFVNYVYKLCGYSMSRVASSIYNNNGTYVEKANLQLGDLVFFASNSSSIGHVGIYIGSGQFIHSSSGAGCVVISDLSSSYYLKNYVGAKRIAG